VLIQQEGNSFSATNPNTRKLVVRNKEQPRHNVKDETMVSTFCEIPVVLMDPCRGLHHVKDWITSARSKGKYRGHVQKDPSSLIKCVTATGTLRKHSH